MSQVPSIAADAKYSLGGLPMAPDLALMFNDVLYERVKDVSRIMAAGRGVTPQHLIGCPEACFMVVSLSLTWRLSPTRVAASTFQTPGGKIGFEGKLVQAIIENSGQIEGRILIEYKGNWSVLRGKFKPTTSAKGHTVMTADWKPELEEGLSIVVSALVKGEESPRSEEVFLRSMWPRNSVLWATRPEQQARYAAIKVFANVAVPGIIMGVPFDTDHLEDTNMREINPRPQREQPKASSFVDWGDDPKKEEEAPPDKDFSVADAYEMGEQAAEKKLPRRAPPEWGTIHDGQAWSDAWLAGWDNATEEGEKS